MQKPIEATGLTKRFGAVTAVENLSLHLNRGEALGVLGTNGAGKSTALAMLMGLRAPDAGDVRLFGHRPGSAAARAVMGVTPQAAGFPHQLTPREILAYADARRADRAQLDAVITAFGLGPLIDRRMAGFSGGEVRRVALALAFLGQPALVFLDEPTSGLDADAQMAFCGIARDHVAKGGSLVLTSHHWDEIEAVCDRITMIDKGSTVLEGSLDDIRARMQARQIGFTLPEGTAPPDWLGAHRQGMAWRTETDDSDATLRRMVSERVPFAGLTVEPIALKDIIARIQKGGRA
jgi:ABC-2 type transport system ATP-binding protein